MQAYRRITCIRLKVTIQPNISDRSLHDQLRYYVAISSITAKCLMAEVQGSSAAMQAYHRITCIRLKVTIQPNISDRSLHDQLRYYVAISSITAKCLMAEVQGSSAAMQAYHRITCIQPQG